MDPYLLGGTAAIVVSILWTANSILFTVAGKRIGALSVNAIRTLIAVGLLVVTHIIILGTILPLANQAQWFWMAVSGIVGLGIGDLALFSAFVMIGPRKSLLLMMLAPICSAIFGYIILGEALALVAIAGIAITLTGIVIVIVEKEEKSEDSALTRKQKTRGIFLGVIGGVGQGISLVFSKYGMVTVADNPAVPLDSLSATLIRMIAAAAFILIYAAVTRRSSELVRAVKDARGIKLTSAGAVIGPFLGVWLSMVAVTYVEAGIAQTLMSLMPVFIIPPLWFLYRERTTWRGILGAAIAVIGVAILFLI